jgi:hypothetical protein
MSRTGGAPPRQPAANALPAARAALSRVCLLAFLADVGAQVAWARPEDGNAPKVRKYSTMVWDSFRSRVVLFGGQLDEKRYHDDTWEWDGSAWLERQPAHRPRAREDHAMAFDRWRGRATIFGGHDVNVVFLSDTWEWDGEDWTRAAPATSPSARAYGAMAFDDVRGLSVMFGGLDRHLRPIAETWEWNGAAWRQRFTRSQPKARSLHAMAFDQSRGSVVLYGGRTADGGSNELWTFDGADWRLVELEDPPPQMVDHRLVYDTDRQRLIAWGGLDQPADRTIEFYGDQWIERRVTPAPRARQAHTMAYDEARGEMVLFGGWDGNQLRLGDTWTYAPMHPATTRPYGSGCPGTAGMPHLTAARPWIGETVVFTVAPIPDGHPAVSFVGSSRDDWLGIPLPLELALIGMPGCLMLTSADYFLGMTPSGPQASVPVTVPSSGELLGLRLYFQAFVLDPGVNELGFVISDAAEVQIGAK